MNYVLLGESNLAPLLLKAIGQSDSKLLGAALCGSMSDVVITTNPGAKLVGQWEDLLSLTDVDAAIVAGANDDVLAAARQLATDGISIVVLPDMKTGSVFTYELSLSRDEADIKLIPALSFRAHPAVEAFKQQLGQAKLGKLIQLRFDRTAERTVADSPVFSIPEIDSYLLLDADLVRLFGGEYNQVTSIRTGKTDDGAATSTVTLAGTDLPEAVWTLNAGTPKVTISAVGDSGEATLSADIVDGQLTNVLMNGETADCDDDQLCRRWLGQIESGLAPTAPREVPESIVEPQPTDSIAADWTQLTRAFEVVEGTRESIRRRRTIDLYFETTSERSLFKTQMAAMGCLVLTWTLFGMVAFLVAGSLISGSGPASPGEPDPGRALSTFEYWMWHTLRILWLAPIVIFAFAQLLLVLARPAKKDV